MEWHKGTPGADWDTKLFARGGHFLQSSHWAAFNQALGKQVFYAGGQDWQCLAIIEPAKSSTRLYCPYGPLAANKKALTAALAALRQLGRSTNAVFARVEPQLETKTNLSTLGLKPALKAIQPPQTWVQDLTKSTDDLMAEFTPTNRNLYRTAANKGLTFRASHNPADMRVFLQMIHDVAARTGMQPHSDHYYQTMADVLLPRHAATLYIAEHNGQPVGAAFVFDSPTTRYYAHAGNLLSARKLHPGAPMLATIIFDAKANGQKLFDFVGVAPQNAPDTHRWAGFTKFKKSFGGNYKQYLGTWELPLKPQYHVYRAGYLLHNKLLRRG